MHDRVASGGRTQPGGAGGVPAGRPEQHKTVAAEWRVIDINRLVGFLLLALSFYFIVTQPHEAAAVARSVMYTLTEAADSIFTFFSEVF